MDLAQVTIAVDAKDAAAVEGLMTLAGAVAVTLIDAADAPLFEPAVGATPLWPRVIVRGLFSGRTDLDSLSRVLEAQLDGPGPMDVAPVVDADWVSGLEQTAEARSFGKRLALTPADGPASVDDRVVVKLNMGLAFGTGRHPTTALCLEWLDSQRLEGTRVLDFGCGTGVLAIAAIKLGAERAWATDNDPQALRATRENARLNDIEHSLWVGPAARIARLRPDLVVANILAGTLIELADNFGDRLRARGRIVLSGILEEQVDAVVAAYRPRFEHFDITSRHGWARVVASAVT